jgi:hypothetical protein
MYVYTSFFQKKDVLYFDNWLIIRVANYCIRLYNSQILSAGVSQTYGTK